MPIALYLSAQTTARNTTKFAQNGELFGIMNLSSAISQDTQEGRLILQNVSTVLLAPAETAEPKQVRTVMLARPK